METRVKRKRNKPTNAIVVFVCKQIQGAGVLRREMGMQGAVSKPKVGSCKERKDGWTTWRKMWTLFLRKKRNNKAWYISKTYCSSLQSDLTSFICNIVVVLLLLALLYPHNDLMDEAVSCLISAAGKMDAWNGANGCME